MQTSMDAHLTEEEAAATLQQLQEGQTLSSSAPLTSLSKADSSASEWWQASALQRNSAEVSKQQSVATSEPTSWSAIFRVLMSSIKASAVHLEAVTLETLALGWLPLVRSHEVEHDNIHGPPVKDRLVVEDLLRHAKWAQAAYDALASATALSKFLDIQLADVIYINATSGNDQGAAASGSLAAHLPAYYLAIDHKHKAVQLVVRGTSALKDLVTDLCGHCVPFLQGHAHYGMLSAAQALVMAEMDRMEMVLITWPGYAVQVIGHSLGGGVAALTACILKQVPELRARLKSAPDITAITYATPPVMTYDLALECASFITTVVNNHDMVARTSVASLAELSANLELAKQEAIQSSEVAALLHRVGAVDAAKTLASAAFKRRLIARPAAAIAGYMSQSAAAKSILGTGITLASTALAARLSTTNTTANNNNSPATQTAATTGSTAQNSTNASASKPNTGSSGSGWGTALSAITQRIKSEADQMREEAKARSQNSATPADGNAATTTGSTPAATSITATAWSLLKPVSNAPPAAEQASTGSVSVVTATQTSTTATTTAGTATESKTVASSAWSMLKSFTAQAASSPAPAEAPKQTASTITTAQTATQQPTATSTSGWLTENRVQGLRLLGGALLNKIDESVSKGNALVQERLQARSKGAQQEESTGATLDETAAAAAAGVNTSVSAVEDQRLHRLYTPGKLYYLQRTTEGTSTTYQLVQGEVEQRFQRLLLKRSMLADHALSSYTSGLTAVLPSCV